MKSGILFFLFAAILLYCRETPALAYRLPDSDQRKCYQEVSPWAEIPCANTGQDGAYLQNPLAYTVNGNGTVTDDNTGLVWQKEDNGFSYNWYRASGTYHATYNPGTTDICGALELGGATDWRLPSRKELMSLVDYSVTSPLPIISPTFPNTKTGNYWTADQYPGDSRSAWYISFGSGIVGSGYKEALACYVRCVRGGE